MNKIKVGREQVIGGIVILMIFVTSVSFIRIAYNQNIVESYESAAKILPEKTKIGMLDRFWQENMVRTRKNVSRSEAFAAKSAVDSSYDFMIGVDVILGIAAAVVAVQPIVAKKFGDKNSKTEKKIPFFNLNYYFFG